MDIITIAPIENSDQEYLAFYRDDFLKCVFSVSFQDTIFGAIILNRFSEMIKTVCKKKTIDFYLSDKKIRFHSQAIIDALTGNKEENNDFRRSL